MSLPEHPAREFSVALEEYNATKNRDTNNLPCELTLAHLSTDTETRVMDKYLYDGSPSLQPHTHTSLHTLLTHTDLPPTCTHTHTAQWTTALSH